MSDEILQQRGRLMRSMFPIITSCWRTFAWISLAWVSLAMTAQEASPFDFINQTDTLVGCHLERFVEDGKETKLSKHIIIGHKEWLPFRISKTFKPRELDYRIATLDGAGPLRSIRSAGKTMTFRFDRKALLEHKRQVAEVRAQRSPTLGVLFIQAPDEAEVTFNTFKTRMRKGAAIYSTSVLRSGEIVELKVMVSFFSAGETFHEEATWTLEPHAPLEWDCRDIAAPNIGMRTAHFMLAGRAILRRHLIEIDSGAGPAACADALGAASKRLERLLARGVDMDAVLLNTESITICRKREGEFREGKAVATDLYATLTELDSSRKQLESKLIARHGRGYGVILDIASSRTKLADLEEKWGSLDDKYLAAGSVQRSTEAAFAGAKSNTLRIAAGIAREESRRGVAAVKAEQADVDSKILAQQNWLQLLQEEVATLLQSKNGSEKK